MYSLNPGIADKRMMYHSKKAATNNQFIITGWDPDQKVKPGFIFWEGPAKEATVYEVASVVERRDHKGVFQNPNDNKNSFFSVACSVSTRDLRESKPLKP